MKTCTPEQVGCRNRNCKAYCKNGRCFKADSEDLFSTKLREILQRCLTYLIGSGVDQLIAEEMVSEALTVYLEKMSENTLPKKLHNYGGYIYTMAKRLHLNYLKKASTKYEIPDPFDNDDVL